MKRRILLYVIVAVVMFTAPGLAVQKAGTGFVEINGETKFSGSLPIRLGAVTSAAGGHSFLAFGEEELFSPLFHFALKSAWRPTPRPETVRYIKEQGVDEAMIETFFAYMDYDTQLLTLMSEEERLEALLTDFASKREEFENELPEEVAGDLQQLADFKQEGYQAYHAEITVLELRATGVRERAGRGVVQYRLEPRQDMEGAVYSGRFWGSYAGDSGPRQVEGNFFAVPYLRQNLGGLDTRMTRWEKDQDEPADSYREELWDEYYSVGKIFIAASLPLTELSHELTVELFTEAGRWQQVVSLSLQPDEEKEMKNNFSYEHELARPLLAGGIRFNLFGLPFSGEHWKFQVYCGSPVSGAGEILREWRYSHGW